MAVTSVEKMWSGRSGADTLLNHRTYRVVYEIIVDDPTTSEVDIVNATGVPQVGSALAIDSGAYMVDFELAVSDDSPFIFYFTAKYDSKPELPEAFDPGAEGAEPGDIDANPLLRPAVWSVSFTKTTEPAVKWYAINNLGVMDANLSLIRNSAKLPFDPPATIEVSRPILRATKNIAPTAATLSFFMSLQDRVNDRVWRGLAKHVARIDGVTGAGKKENGINFVEVAIDIALKWDTWALQLLDCGYAELTTRTVPGPPVAQQKTWTKIRDPFGQEASEPVPLNGAGRKLAPDADPVYLKGLPENLREANFAALLGI